MVFTRARSVHGALTTRSATSAAREHTNANEGAEAKHIYVCITCNIVDNLEKNYMT